MKKTSNKFSSILLAVILSISLFSFKGDNGVVAGWHLAGSDKEAYEIGTSIDKDRIGKVAFLKSIKPKLNNKFGTIMQSFDAEIYLDKRMKLTGFIKTTDVKDWVGIWMRIDGAPKVTKKVLGFDNMQNRKIQGTTVWTKYEIILDVPKNSSRISYGVLLSGTGNVLLDDLSFEEVNKEKVLTNSMYFKKPTNSSFED